MKTFRAKPTERRDHYQELTDKIIAALEAGTAPWRRPWNPGACGASTTPLNATTGRRYRGVNLFVLGMSPFALETGDPRWCSYRQAQARGWQVRKGERSTPIYFYKPLEVADRSEDGDGETRRIPLLRVFSVFHASQIDGIPDLARPPATKTVVERIEDVEQILTASGVPIRIGGDRAFYSPAGDFIQLPPDAAFESPAERAATALHEFGHASGAKHRLDRDLTGRFGSSGYSREELRVELASVFVGNAIGLPTDIPNHASYIDSWLKNLKQDRREIFRAAADAQKIADYILALHPAYAADDAGDAAEGSGEETAPTPLAA